MISDPVLAYANAVIDGEIIAGPMVRDVCAKFVRMRELAEDPSCPYVWNAREAQKLIDFFPDVLVVTENGEDVHFYQLDWQMFCSGWIAGWRWRETGYRCVREVYVEGAKGCGKTPWAAGLGLYFLAADGERLAEVYSAAAKREQAMILFQDAVTMKQTSPVLNSRLLESGRNPVWQLKHRTSRSVFRALSADKKKSGMRPSCVLIDELHEHKDRYTVDMMTAGFKGRAQPIAIVITNSGSDRTSICWEWRERARKWAESDDINPSFFGYVMSLDPGDDPLEDPECWPKTNPGIGVTVTWEYLESRVQAARETPGIEPNVRRLNFCQWVEQGEGWFTRKQLQAIEEELVEFALPRTDLTGGGAALWTRDEGFDQAECYVGLDLAYVTDMAALAFVFPEGDKVCAWVEFFKPLGHTLEDLRAQERADDAPYIEWIRQGHIHGVPGPTIRKEAIGARIAEAMSQYKIRRIAFDRYAHKALAEDMADLGVEAPWIEHPQGFRRGGVLRHPSGAQIIGSDGQPVENPLWMPSSVAGMESRVMESTIALQPCPVLRWQFSNAKLRQDPAGTGNRVPDKAKSVARIDGVVALVMGVAANDARWPVDGIEEWLKKPVVSQ